MIPLKDKKYHIAYIVFIIILLLYIGAALALCHTPLFWDSISILSKPATFLYENRFTNFSFPDGTGVTDNMPISCLLALWWMVFGKSLVSTHILFMLFGIGVLYRIFQLCLENSPYTQAVPFILILSCSDTALITQLLIPMFDSVLLFFFLSALRALFNRKGIAIIFYTSLLAMARSRGIIWCGALGLIYLLIGYQEHHLKESLRKIYLFIPALAVAVFLFLFQFYHQNKVFGIGADSPWSLASPYLVFRHALSFPRFLLEYGRFFLWAVFLYLLLHYGRKSLRSWISENNILLSCAVSFVICLIISIPFKNPYGPNYFLPFFVLFALDTGRLIFARLSFKRAYILCLISCVMLWSGHLWHYPDSIATSWSTTLAHLPYYSLKQELSEYLQTNNIDNQNIKTFFPLEKPDYWSCLSGTKTDFSSSENPPYILHSNLCNQSKFTDSAYVLLHRFARSHVHIDLYKKREDLSSLDQKSDVNF